MKKSAAKTVARRILYLDLLPQWLDRQQLQSSHYLILMGPEPCEIAHLDALNVPRHQIWSVERDATIYEAQQALNLGVSLYHGDMHSYLDTLLHGNQKFQVLNLDIEGSYLVNIDPSMSSVLLFCWRNPQTVVSMSWSIGRDTECLIEGAKSLAFFLWVDEATTLDFTLRLAERYAAAGFEKPFHMVLRDLFWMRSILEHTLITAMWMGVAHQPLARRLLMVPDLLGETIWLHRRQPITLGLLQKVVAYWRSTDSRHGIIPSHLLDEPALGVEIEQNTTILYRAKPPWSQEYQATKFACAPAPVTVHKWTKTAMERYLHNPMIYVGRSGERTDIGCDPGRRPSLNDPVCDVDFSRHETRRDLNLLPPRHLGDSVRDLTGRRVRQHSAHPAMPNALRRGQKSPAVDPLPVPPVEELAHPCITEKEIPVPKTKAKKTKPTTKNPKTAASNGSKNGSGKVDSKHFMRDGKLTDQGVERIRALAKSGLDTSDIMKMVPDSVPERVVRAHVAVSRRK